MDLKIDPENDAAQTGLFVRAMAPDGKFGSYDIGLLDRESLITWLRSRGGENVFAENCVLVMLNHKPIK